MLYTRLPHDSLGDNLSSQKGDLTIRPQSDLFRFFLYRNLFGAALALWIATSIVLGWVLAQKPAGNGNHVVTLLPFPPGIDDRFKEYVSGCRTD
jgi:hypothetical protein